MLLVERPLLVDPPAAVVACCCCGALPVALPLGVCPWCPGWATSPPAALPSLDTLPGGCMFWQGRGARAAAAAWDWAGCGAGGGAARGWLMVVTFAVVLGIFGI